MDNIKVPPGPDCQIRSWLPLRTELLGIPEAVLYLQGTAEITKLFQLALIAVHVGFNMSTVGQN